VSSAGPVLTEEGDGGGRRQHVLEVALLIFARYGYRKASMDDLAGAADIFRPGLYFYFASKQDLVRAAVIHALDGDIAAAERSLADADRPLGTRIIDAFDHWTGRYVGPMSKDFAALIESNPDLLGSVSTEYPKRFAKIVTDALTAAMPAERGLARDVAQTLLSTAIGIKHDANDRQEFVTRMTVAVDLLVSAVMLRIAGRDDGPL
jgi:AcrR family transcriptional regulator